MNPRHFSIGAGILFLVLGILGFIPGLLTERLVMDPDLAVNAFYGRLFNLFPVNAVLNIFWIIMGIAGISAYSSRGRDLPASINFARSSFVIMGALALLGLFPGSATLWGIAPLFGNNIWLHGFTSLVGAYYGYSLTAQVNEDQRPAEFKTPHHQRLGDQF